MDQLILTYPLKEFLKCKSSHLFSLHNFINCLDIVVDIGAIQIIRDTPLPLLIIGMSYNKKT